MKKFLVTYTEVFTGQKEVIAESGEQAMEQVRQMIESDNLDPTNEYDGHEITVDYAEEV